MRFISTYFTPPVQVLETADSGDEKAITAMGLLNTMETILAVMEEKPEVHRRGGTLLCTVQCWNDHDSKGLVSTIHRAAVENLRNFHY
jgi:hypothetical protein